jgi:hypothetical protein
MSNYPTTLLTQIYKINKKQFSKKFRLEMTTEQEYSKYLNTAIIDYLNSKHNMNMKIFVSLIHKYGEEFKKNCINNIKNIETLESDIQEIYNQFVGDYFEAFAEFFLKSFNNDSRYGVKDYLPNIDKEDMGVDGYGFCYDDTNGRNPCVIQVKYRSNPMDEITYSALAKTFCQGILEFKIEKDIDKNLILFGSSDANYKAKDFFKKELFVISDKAINMEINNVEFWVAFCNCF